MRDYIIYSYLPSVLNVIPIEGDLSKRIQEKNYDDDSSLPSAIIRDFKEELSEDLQQKILQVQPYPTARLSKNYDPSKPYIPRSQRKEWIKVGLMGKIPVYDDGSCIPGRKCDCVNGIATLGNRWHVMRRISENTVLVLFK